MKGNEGPCLSCYTPTKSALAVFSSTACPCIVEHTPFGEKREESTTHVSFGGGKFYNRQYQPCLSAMPISTARTFIRQTSRKLSSDSSDSDQNVRRTLRRSSHWQHVTRPESRPRKWEEPDSVPFRDSHKQYKIIPCVQNINNYVGPGGIHRLFMAELRFRRRSNAALSGLGEIFAKRVSPAFETSSSVL